MLSVPAQFSPRCRSGRAGGPAGAQLFTVCKAQDMLSLRLEDAYNPGHPVAMGRFRQKNMALREEMVMANTAEHEAGIFDLAARIACQRRSSLVRNAPRVDRSPWWKARVDEGSAKSPIPGTFAIGPGRICSIGRRLERLQSDDSFQVTGKKRCITRNMPNGWRQRVCVRLSEERRGYEKRFGPGSEFDVRIKDAEGRVLGKAMFEREGPSVHTEGMWAAIGKHHQTVQEEMYRFAARVACRENKNLLSLGHPGDYHKGLASPYWLDLWKAGLVAPATNRRGRLATPESIDANADRRLVMSRELACSEGKKPSRMNQGDAPKKPRQSREYTDQGYEMSPAQFARARCRSASFNRSERMQVCDDKETRAREMKVYDKIGDLLGKGYFTHSNDTLWTVGVKGTPEAKLDMELLAARMACVRGQKLASDFKPEESFFWRAQVHAGRAHREEMDDGSLFLSAKGACQGTHMYGPKGLVEPFRRRPGIYFQGLRSRK